MWVVAKTKPNQENKAQKNLINQGYETYLPFLKIKKYVKNQWVIHKEALFSSYIFINLQTINKIHKINYTYGISKLLINQESGFPYAVNKEIIDTIKSNLKSDKLLNINSLEKGNQVVVTKDNLSSLKGIFLEKSSKYRSKLLIKFLNNERILTVDNQYIQRIYA